MPANALPLVLLTGLAADERLFAAQRVRFPHLHVPRWIEPLARESLAAYAKRLAMVVDPGCPCIVGGASFGGAVSLEMATHLQARACVLIGSIQSPDELPWRWRILGPILGPRRLGAAAQCFSAVGGWCLPRRTRRDLARLARPEANFARWATGAILNWRPSPATKDVRVFRIHGAADRTIPIGNLQPDTLVANGQHALSLFNASAVNEFLERVCNQIAVEMDGGGLNRR